ncbi:hypothetical protein [Flavobacterium flavigenum]|uniref:hypothetical protein n=1 Tax=Flavobacterium flavigenum TaxID=3003258 RepID=UPI0022AC4062|nr:hypothetical protein [Flavobacterium flavigenum]
MKINDLDLLELDNSKLESTKFYSVYSSLSFNKGIIFKRIGTKSSLVFSGSISKEINEVKNQNTGGLIRIEANNQIHDFIYELLKHKDIDKKWRYNDDVFFTEFSMDFNSLESFRKIGLFEINSEEFKRNLLSLAIVGSCYKRINYSEQEIKTMIQDFVDQLLNDVTDRIIVSTMPWGEYHIGWFACFFIIRKNDIIIFGQDDYD